MDSGWYFSAGLIGTLFFAALAIPSVIRARFPRLYRGPLATIGERVAQRDYGFGPSMAGLITALAAVAVLRWLWPSSFAGPGLSLPAAVIFGLVVYMSFAIWRYLIRAAPLRP
ncbi:MAG TPA: hypothetical protein VIN74_03090 [Candidatus Limnocylindria bacterium]